MFDFLIQIMADKISLECFKCGYKLQRREIPKMCPYCNSQDSVGNAKTAQDVLEESSY